MPDKVYSMLGNRVLVKRKEADAVTKGGIIMPENAREKPLEGTVVAAGPGATTDKGFVIPMQTAVGDVVLFGKYAGVEVEDGLLALREDEILAILS